MEHIKFVYFSLFYAFVEASSAGSVASSVQTVLDLGVIWVMGTGEIILDKGKPKVGEILASVPLWVWQIVHEMFETDARIPRWEAS
jgi:hypothetical protein